MGDIIIEAMGPEAWERVKEIRLRALRDAPDAFGRTFAEESERAEEEWRSRLESPAAVTYVAVREGRDVGLVSGADFRGREGSAGLFSMWVAPRERGRGTGGALVRVVISWARGKGYARLLLHVADDNPAATRLYERHGFLRNGRTGTLPPPREHITEHERVLDLADD